MSPDCPALSDISSTSIELLFLNVFSDTGSRTPFFWPMGMTGPLAERAAESSASALIRPDKWPEWDHLFLSSLPGVLRGETTQQKCVFDVILHLYFKSTFPESIHSLQPQVLDILKTLLRCLRLLTPFHQSTVWTAC